MADCARKGESEFVIGHFSFVIVCGRLFGVAARLSLSVPWQFYSTCPPAARISSRARSPSPGCRFTARTPSRRTVVAKPSRRASRAVSLTQ